MTAGESAANEAERARRAAAVLERKARYAAKVADDYGKGAAGEVMVAEALELLSASGWRTLHDLRAPDGGNIDHLAIGPPGIAVIDAKNWGPGTTVTLDRRLVVSKHDRTEDLNRLDALSELVRSTVARDGLKVAVRGYLVLTGEADRDRTPEHIGDLRILGVDRLGQRLSSGRGDLSPELIEALADALQRTFPPASAPVPPPQRQSVAAPDRSDDGDSEPSGLFERAHRFYYLRPWKKGGHHRLYLRDRDGTSLGWTDVNTGATSVECGGAERKFAEALLAAADPTGIKLSPGDLPKVATRLWGGRLLSKVARFHTSVLVGQEWRAFGKHRLYGTLIDPSVTTFALGHIDLKTGERHPSMEGRLSEDRSEPDRYLRYLLHHFPDR
ncbi:MAG: hypothetical protein JWM47_2491 [Acidimicrobiales bacterium]|nr:hypothetical protein [Acidimicrobiales bacterium]